MAVTTAVSASTYTQNKKPVWISEYKPFTGTRIVVTNAMDDYAMPSPIVHSNLHYSVFTGTRLIQTNLDDKYGLSNTLDYTGFF